MKKYKYLKDEQLSIELSWTKRGKRHALKCVIDNSMIKLHDLNIESAAKLARDTLRERARVIRKIEYYNGTWRYIK